LISDTWHERFLVLAEHVAQWSKDPSTKVGAVLVRPDKTIASVGFNGFPRGMDDSLDLLNIRDIRMSRVIHAEMNAVLNARDTLPHVGFTLYTTGPCCDRCAVHMIQCGIRNFVWRPVDEERKIRWHVETTLGYLREAKASVLEIPHPSASPASPSSLFEAS
jgi:dCMP deaminase